MSGMEVVLSMRNYMDEKLKEMLLEMIELEKNNQDIDYLDQRDILLYLFTDPENIEVLQLAKSQIAEESFKDQYLKKIYDNYMENHRLGKPIDILSIAIDIDDIKCQKALAAIAQIRVNRGHVHSCLKDLLIKIKEKRKNAIKEALKLIVTSGFCDDDVVLEIAHEFEKLRASPY